MSTDLKVQVTSDVVSSSSNGNTVIPLRKSGDQNLRPTGTSQAVRQDNPVSGNVVPEVANINGDAVNPAEISQAVNRLNDHVQNISRDLEFTIDEELNRTIITVYDSETEEVIRQIPPDEVLTLARYLESEGSVIMKTKA
jgi:flagellar protein FlaG